jgi:hypothetical protein
MSDVAQAQPETATPTTTQTSTTTPPAPNTPEARTATGELIDANAAGKSGTSGDGTPPADATATGDTPKVPDGVPDTYTFTAPDGRTLDAGAIEAATPIFKELGLNQAQADKLVEFYNKQTGDIAQKNLDAVNTMREGWRTAVNADPEIGGKLDAVKADIGKALSQLPPALSQEFRDAMDLTGAGDHPAFIKAFHKFAQMVNEGKAVTAAAPSPHGQKAPGAAPRSLASTMYPNLP